MRVNFRLSTLMVATAVIGVAVWGIIGMATERRRAYYRQRVESFAFGEADVLEQIALKLAAARQAEGDGPEGCRQATALRAEAERLARVGAWHVKMEQKYVRAVDRPWEPLAVDYPPP